MIADKPHKPHDPDIEGYDPSSSFLLDIAPLLLTAVLLMVQFFVFKDFTPHIPLACGILITGLFMKMRGRSWEGMEESFLKVVKIGLPAMIILMGVGMLIGAWIIAYTIPTILYYGFKSETGFAVVDQLLSKGGVMSMTWVVTLTIFALAFVGSIEHYGTLKAIMAKINNMVKSRFGLVISTYASTIGVDTLMGDVYTTLVLPGRLLKDKYKEIGYKRTTLTRSIEDTGTLLSPLIPWNMGGSFVAATLGIATLTYAPFAFACWLSPLFGLLWVELNKFIPREEPTVINNKSTLSTVENV